MNSSLQEYFSLPSNSREVHPPPCTGEEQGDCQLMQVPQQAPSIWRRQFRQGRGSCQTPGAFAFIIPDIPRYTPPTPCSARRHAGCRAFLAGLQETVLRRCSQHPKDMLSFLQGTLSLKTRHRRSCADTASYPHCTVLTHPGHFPTVWRRNWWLFFFFPTSHLTTESVLTACRCLVPFSPTDNSFLWRALGIHTAPCFRHPKHGICKGIGSCLWNYFSCLTAGKGAISRCTLSIRAFHHMPFGNCGCALQVYSERPHARGKLWAT